MIKYLKSNKIIILLSFIVCIILLINPTIYAKSCLNAISVWGLKVLPGLFPFFILTRLIVQLSEFKPNPMDKFFKKAYHSPTGGFFIFLLSVISGYPMGAKLICSMYENGNIDYVDAKRMFSYVSISGPMFMIGTVGVSILLSYKAGLVILISNIIACLINGLLYRGKEIRKEKNQHFSMKKSENILVDTVYDSLLSILMVGAYIVLSFLIIDIFREIHIFDFISNIICHIFNCQKYNEVINGILSGIIEITRGCLDISNTNISLIAKTIIASTIIAFGGISVMMQSTSFLSKVKIPIKTMLLQKLTQAFITLIVTIPLAFLIL